MEIPILNLTVQVTTKQQIAILLAVAFINMYNIKNYLMSQPPILTNLFKFLHSRRPFDRPLIGQIHQSNRVFWLP